MLQDLQTAFRAIARDRWLTAAAVTALALGIGVNATVFTLVNAVLLRGLPFPESHNLYILGTRNVTTPGGAGQLSFRELEQWREQTRAFSGMGGFAQTMVNVADDAAMPEQQRAARVTPETFQVLRVRPVIGRDFRPEDGRPGAEPVVILGDLVWQTRYGSNPDISGKTVRINGQQTVIIGVMPPNMKFPTSAELWMPAMPPVPALPPRDLTVVARLRDGITLADARTDLETIAARLAAEFSETNTDIGPVIQTANERFNGGEIRTVFLAMLGAVGFVLLIACANVANLQLSRSMQRAREIAVRVALGATRWRIVRQLLVESVLIACIGGLFGLLIALGGIRLFDAAVVDSGKPYWIEFTLDYTVLAYFAAICVATGLIFGLAPALQISRTNVNGVLKEGGRGNTAGRRTHWLSGGMVVVELALTIVLLAGAGLMIRSFLAIYTVDVGIPTDRLLAMRLMLPQSKYPSAEQRIAFYDQLLPRLAATAGTEGVAVTTTPPGSNPGSRRLTVEGRDAAARWQDLPQVGAVAVSPSFFDTAGLGILRGRALSDADGSTGQEVVVINERFAVEHFAGEDPIGRRVRLMVQETPAGRPEPAWRTVVGVSRNIRHSHLEETTTNAVAYVPYRQEPPFSALLLVRSGLAPGAVMQTVRQEVQAVDPDQPVFTVQTFDQMRAQSTWGLRVFGSIFAIFAVIALTLSAVGLYAVMAYSVTQRTQEIGVRMALGAQGPQVWWLVLKRGLLQLGLGLALGLAGAVAVSRVLASLLAAGVTPQDPLTFMVITGVLLAVSLSACLIPARRASRVDPLVALRD